MELSLDFNRQYTYADYLTWADDKMRELLNGFIRMMSPAPTLKHAIVSSRLSNKIFNYIERKRGNCQVFYAPFDVRLPKNPDEKELMYLFYRITENTTKELCMRTIQKFWCKH